MKRELTHYDGPTGPFIATEQSLLPLTSVEGMAAIMDSAMLVSLGHTERAAAYRRLVESAKAHRSGRAVLRAW
jgi:hypothetical protein